jgi:hypothetical protein
VEGMELALGEVTPVFELLVTEKSIEKISGEGRRYLHFPPLVGDAQHQQLVVHFRLPK